MSKASSDGENTFASIEDEKSSAPTPEAKTEPKPTNDNGQIQANDEGERQAEGQMLTPSEASGAQSPGADGGWTPEIQKQYRKLKSALNKAIKAKDWPKVIEEADRGLAYFEANAYPDDWNTWVRAKEDAEQEIKRAPVLSDADKALLDAMEGLFASELPSSLDAELAKLLSEQKFDPLDNPDMNHQIQGGLFDEVLEAVKDGRNPSLKVGDYEAGAGSTYSEWKDVIRPWLTQRTSNSG